MDDEGEVPEAWRAAAEEVRAHLCTLRGGAPFLSPADAWQLVRWLEDGVSVASVLQALERAALARRKERRQRPLSIVGAKRHLGRPNPGFFHKDSPALGDAPLAPLVRSLRIVPDDFDRELLATLEGDLLAIPSGDPTEDRIRTALAAVRRFLDAAWSGAGPDRRARWAAEAEAELGDLLALVDERTRVALVEETARDRLRQRYPALTAATLTELLGGGAPDRALR